VTIVSGALFSFEGTNAADYWNQVVDAGRNTLAWDWMHQNVGSWPYDGIGYHIYVGQGSSATTSSVASATQANLDGIWSAVSTRDDQAAQKKLWLSEFGWTIDQVSADQQAQFLTTSFDTYAANANVAAAFWFTYQDFPNGRYGLFDGGGLAVANRRPAYASFSAAVAKYAVALAARFVGDDAPASMAPGETRTVTLTVHNGGSATWSEASKMRLGAAPGCPSAAAKNAFLFVPGASGYANGVDDARVTLAAAVAPAADATFTFAITAPATAGDYVLGARMVRDGVAWFGDTFRATIHVANDGGGAGGGGTGGGGTGGSDGGSPGDGNGGTSDGSGNPEAGGSGTPAAHHGCSVGAGVGARAGSSAAARSTDGGTTFPILVIVSALALFRRREKPLV
jgi:hypothetical protein